MSKNYGQTGVASDVALGKGGPRVKDNSGVVQHRNSADTAYARTQGATPIAAADLTTMAYVDGKLGALPSMDAYDSAGGTGIAVGSWTDVPLGTNRQIDTAQFTHLTPAADFTWVGVSGTKVIILGRITASASGGPTTLRGRIMLDTGMGFAEVTGARASGDIAGGEQDSVYPQAILTLNNGDRVKIQADHTNMLAITTLIANSSGINAVALENPASGTGNTFDNRGLPIISPSAVPAASVDFDVPLGLPVGTATWFKLVSVAGSVGGNIKVYSDALRTKLIYNGNFTTTTHIEGTPWSSIADDETDLESDTLHCTVTNNGILPSTYEMVMRFQG